MKFRSSISFVLLSMCLALPSVKAEGTDNITKGVNVIDSQLGNQKQIAAADGFGEKHYLDYSFYVGDEM